ncbi:proton-conducting transporter membrane subunit [Niabella insulamsoli]|uniref:proton-conducting transporter transmembrane domain-containing protein n=1 Tax=Niabella insulamsoli TaxID=3144874 RepID=UPI0031FE2289
MSGNLILAPVFIHLLIAIFQLMAWRKTVTQRILSIGGAFIALLSAIMLFAHVFAQGTLTINASNWKAPFSIVFVADLLATVMVLLTSIAGFAVSLFSATGLSRQRMLYGYFPIFHFLLMGLNGAFLTGDIFNLYVWFEVIIIASFVLMTLGGRRNQLEGALKYMSMNILASMFFLTGIGILYGMTGSLNMADLSIKMHNVQNRSLVGITSVFFILGFGIKSAVFPLYFWLPSSYHTPPSAVAATFGGLLTKVGIYAMLRVNSLIFIPDDFTKNLLMVIAVLTILTGAFGSLNKMNIRQLFSYLIVCHIGFMVGGISMFTKLALTGTIFYLIHDIMVKTNLFLISGFIMQLRGIITMEKLGGLYKEYPKVSLLVAIVLFSLVGIPPLSGFWPKIYLFQAAFNNSNYFFIAALILGSLVTLYVVAKMWSEIFWKQTPDGVIEENKFEPLPVLRKLLLLLPIGLLAAASVYIGLNAEAVVQISERIAAELLDTSSYINAVFKN